jgi:DnaK suppressor protein
MTKITKKLLEELKSKLEKEEKLLEEELKKFAEKDKRLEGDWDTRFPHFDGGETGSAALEKAADEIEEYSTLLPIEYVLETRLQNIHLALKKIKRAAKGEPGQGRGKYGICEKCGREIEVERLKISPEARLCLKCARLKKS